MVINLGPELGSRELVGTEIRAVGGIGGLGRRPQPPEKSRQWDVPSVGHAADQVEDCQILGPNPSALLPSGTAVRFYHFHGLGDWGG